MTTAEPGPVAHPALTWQQDNIIITMLGEGFTPEVVRDVAESLEPVTRDEFLTAGFDKQGCDQ